MSMLSETTPPFRVKGIAPRARQGAQPTTHRSAQSTMQSLRARGVQSATGTQPRAHSGSALLGLFDASGFDRRFQPDSVIALDGEAAEALYLTVSGTVRCCTIDAQGRRQIFRFATRGDVIGISDIDTWHFTAEAVDCVTLRALSRDLVERELMTNIALRHEFRERTCQLLHRRERQLLALITGKAAERLLHFLHEFAASRPCGGRTAVALPMCRRDIADHLGLSVETVSRAFTELRNKGHIEMVTAEKFRLLLP